MTKLEIVSTLFQLVVQAQENSHRVRMDLTPDYISIMHFVNMGGIIGSVQKYCAFIYEGEPDEYDKTVNYLQTLIK